MQSVDGNLIRLTSNAPLTALIPKLLSMLGNKKTKMLSSEKGACFVKVLDSLQKNAWYP